MKPIWFNPGGATADVDPYKTVRSWAKFTSLIL